MKKFSVSEIAEYGCILAFAMIASYIEAILPVFWGAPGMKLGLANAAIVFCLYRNGAVPALAINISRILLCTFLFHNWYSLWYASAGALFSFVIMIFLKKTKAFSITGVSVAGGVAHNLGQLLIAFLITKIPVLFAYVPVLLIAGTVTGFFNGRIAGILYKRIKPLENKEKI